MPVDIPIGKRYSTRMVDEVHSKEKTVLAAAKLLRQHGYHGVALRDIVAAAGSPRGSLYFHFPNGKEEIAVAALNHAADMVRQGIAGAAKSSKSADEFVVRILRGMAADLERSDFKEGCPIAPIALEMSGSSELLTAAARNAFQSWEAAMTTGLQAFQLKPDSAKLLATAVLSLLEGALVLARAYQTLEPMQRAEQSIKLLVRGFSAP